MWREMKPGNDCFTAGKIESKATLMGITKVAMDFAPFSPAYRSYRLYRREWLQNLAFSP